MKSDRTTHELILVHVPSSYIHKDYIGHYLECPLCGDFVLKGTGYGSCSCGNISIDSDMLRVSHPMSKFEDINQYWGVSPSTTCPVCGYQGLPVRPYEHFDLRKYLVEMLPPYEVHFGKASYQVCDCCGFEFGNDDNPGTGRAVSFTEYRNEWTSGGAKWFTPRKKGSNWNLQDQLTKAGLK